MKTLLPLALVASLLVSAPAVAEDGPEPLSVVVTTEVLGSVVDQLAGDLADVTVLMSGGVDPHSWQPSARDSQGIFEADLIVANGLDLEEGLASVLEQAEADGVPVFRAADHVQLRASAGAEPDPQSAAENEDEAGHEHAVGDPHFWLDPLAMRDVVVALAPILVEAGVELGDRGETFAVALEALDTELAATLAAVPAELRRLVTGHGALGYFADRYGFEIVGTVVPGLSSADEPSAREIAALIEDINASGATAVFTDVGTPQPVARAVADETGARIVELQVAQLPAGGSYQDLLRELSRQVVAALTGTDPEADVEATD